MKSTLELLSLKEKQALANFHGSDAHKALVKLLELERLELAKDHVGLSDINIIRFLSGQAENCRKTIKTLDEVYKSKKV